MFNFRILYVYIHIYIHIYIYIYICYVVDNLQEPMLVSKLSNDFASSNLSASIVNTAVLTLTVHINISIGSLKHDGRYTSLNYGFVILTPYYV
jgi:hypothetical protein